MKQSKTSKAWMHEHVSDFYVKQAKKQGYRSRAAYKKKKSNTDKARKQMSKYKR